MHRFLEHAKPVGWICIGLGMVFGALVRWLVENAAILSLALTFVFGLIGVWIQFEGLKVKWRAEARSLSDEAVD